jgi:beta-glucosidase
MPIIPLAKKANNMLTSSQKEKQMKSNKKMKNGLFLGIWIPALVIASAVAIAVPVAAETLKMVLDTYINHGDIVKTSAPETATWDKAYDKARYETKEEAVAASEKKVAAICDEGFVLLKNRFGALPIPTSKEITMLGRDSVDSIYGGSGSGNIDSSTAVTPLKGLQNAGFSVNEEAYGFFARAYADYPRAIIAMNNYAASTYFIGEIPAKAYAFSPVSDDVALVFIGRGGGEGGDLSTNLKRDDQTTASQSYLAGTAKGENSVQATNAAAEAANHADGQHQLELSAEEKGMIGYAEANYEKTVVVINSSNVMEIGDLKNDEGVDAVIWVGSPGSSGYDSLGKILSGAVNPSGRTADTWPNDLTADPSFQNFGQNGSYTYSDIGSEDAAFGEGKIPGVHFVEYEEGIYVGYRYYETRFGSSAAAYDAAVAYPFGYGLSYTTFEETIKSHSDPTPLNDVCNVTVTVKNTGDREGKTAVELYYEAPYTAGGIEKSSVNLLAFAKSDLLLPGASQDIGFSWDKSEMAS